MFTRSFIRKLFTAAASCVMLSSFAAAKVSASDIIKGDINCDGIVSDDDLTFMSRYLSGKGRIYRLAYYNGDMNNDGNVDSIDLIQLRKFLRNVNEPVVTTTTAAQAIVSTVQVSGTVSETQISSPLEKRRYRSVESIVAEESSFSEDDFIKAPLSEMPGSLSSEGEGRVCIFYVDFPDCPYTYEPSMSEIEQMAFDEEASESKHYPFESINSFYQRSSKHRVRLSGEAYRYTTKYDKEIYENDVYKLRLIDEIIHSLNDEIDFRDFDNDGDNVIDAILISVPQAAGDKDWWPCAGKYAGSLYPVVDGVKMGNIVVGNAEIKSCKDYEHFAASYIHELGHCMGLPDYYLYCQANTEGLHGSAGFDTMDELYVDFSCASKLMLGWYRDSQIQIFDYNGDKEQLFTLTDGQSENGNCLIIPYNNQLADDYCSEYLILEYTTLNNNNQKIPEKYWFRNYGSGIRVLHVQAITENLNGVKDLMFKSSKTSFYEYYFGRRFVRVINDSNIDNLFRTGKIICHDIDGFGFYDCTGTEICDPAVDIYVGELEGDSYNIIVRKKG